jgi:putative glutamine amidotransferase
MYRPVIAITTYREDAAWGVWRRPADLLGAGYADAVLAAGGAPVLLPPLAEAAVDVLRAVDGVVLAGGADVEPQRYDAPRDPATGPPRPDRDEAELALTRACLERGVPLLAICRGMQILDVALGGDLIQHLPVELSHRGGEGFFQRRTVDVEAGSRLASIVGTRFEVHCYHHQAVGRLGEGLRPVAWSEDGVVEAVELRGAEPLVLGVQSHPEESADRRLFEALVRAAGPT